MTYPYFLRKKGKSVFFNFFLWGTVWSQIAICCCATITWENVSIFGTLKLRCMKKIDKVITLSGFLKIPQNFSFCSKIGILKTIVFKNAKYIRTWSNLVYKHKASLFNRSITSNFNILCPILPNALIQLNETHIFLSTWVVLLQITISYFLRSSSYVALYPTEVWLSWYSVQCNFTV